MNKESEHKKPKICFVSLNSYPILKKKNLGYVGGAEIQQVELGKELNKRGYEISFITYGKDRDNIEKIDGIEIIPAYDRGESNNLSFLTKILKIWKKMKEVDADIYYYHAGSPGITSIFARFHQKKKVSHIASDSQVTGEIIIAENIFVGLLGKMGDWLDIKLSDIVISQNNFQKSKLKDRFNVESVIVNNSFYIPPISTIDHNADYLLWVGTIRSVKQPELFLKFAKHFPEHNFLMIGGKGESLELFKKIKNAADKIQNLEFKGFVEHDKIFDYYKKSILLINTSKREGFPNIFLEAWMHFLPVISLNVNPDGIISRYKMGYHSKTFEQMLEDVRTLLDDKKLRQAMGKNGRRYIEDNHDLINIADQYETLIRNLQNK